MTHPDANDVVLRGAPCPTCYVITSDFARHGAWHLKLAATLERIEGMPASQAAP